MLVIFGLFWSFFGHFHQRPPPLIFGHFWAFLPNGYYAIAQAHMGQWADAPRVKCNPAYIARRTTYPHRLHLRAPSRHLARGTIVSPWSRGSAMGPILCAHAYLSGPLAHAHMAYHLAISHLPMQRPKTRRLAAKGHGTGVGHGKEVGHGRWALARAHCSLGQIKALANGQE